MFSGSIVLILACFAACIIMQTFVPAATAIKQPNAIDDYVVGDRGSRKRLNYRLQRMNDDEISKNTDNIYYTHVTETFDPDANREELSAFIEDYANSLRNDIILLDNSVETRTRKRGNIKVEKKYNQQVIPGSTCGCKYESRIKDLGENAYPQFVETRNCSGRIQQTCVPPYMCIESIYNLKILRRKEYPAKDESVVIPSDLKTRWVGENVPVSVGCVCSGNYIIQD